MTLSRAVIALDRLAAILTGLVLIAAGIAAFAWHQGLIPDAPQRLTSSWMPALVHSGWWPWATAVAGLILLLLGLVWILRHLTSAQVGDLGLNGSDSTGSLQIDSGAAVGAAASELTHIPGVRSCRGHVRRERGQIILEVDPLLEPSADLRTVQQATEVAGTKLLTLLGRDDLTYRATLRVARRRHQDDPPPRVH